MACLLTRLVCDVVRLLRGSSCERVEDNIKALTDGRIADYLLCAQDGHAKNYGVLLIDGRPETPPRGDAASGLPCDAFTQTGLRHETMKIGRSSQCCRIPPEHWEASDRRLIPLQIQGLC